MLYVEHRPGAPLSAAIERLWYVRRPAPATAFESVLPGSHVELILNLAADHCTAVAADGSTLVQSSALAIGLHTEAHLIATADTAEMIGAVLTATGARRLLRHPAHLLRGRELPLCELLGDAVTDRLRSEVRKAPTPEAKFRAMERGLQSLMQEHETPSAVLAALDHLRGRSHSIEQLGQVTGLSTRRLRSLFEEEVGVPPKTFARMLRFRRALMCLYRGDDLRWAEFALDCGYADQSHFCNDFRAFSGISPTTYRRQAHPWAGHVPI